jgi:hypothetical protein
MIFLSQDDELEVPVNRVVEDCNARVSNQVRGINQSLPGLIVSGT